MKKRYGIQIDSSGDLSVVGGHLAMGDTMAQNEYILLMAQRGDIKEYPAMGAGIADMVGSNSRAEWQRKVRDALLDDGMDVKSLVFDAEGNITTLNTQYR